MKVRKNVRYTEYQVNKLLEKSESDFERQWAERVAEIENATFENVKADMFAQFMSCAMATLQKYHNFTPEQSKEFYDNYVSLLKLMNHNPLGKEFTPQNCINSIKEDTGLDLDKEAIANNV